MLRTFIQFAAPGLTVDAVPLHVEIARTPEERRQGLADRESIAPGSGMAFVWPYPTREVFTMERTYFPLDIMWLNREGYVLAMTEAMARDQHPIVSPVPYQFVIEAPRGYARYWSIGVGTPVLGLKEYANSAV